MELIKYTNEYSRLRKVAVYKPSLDEISQRDIDYSMYLEIPRPKLVLEQFEKIISRLKELEIEVIILESKKDEVNTPNMIFLRDDAFIYGDKILLANMKHEIRRPEPKKLESLLVRLNKDFSNSFIHLDQSLSMEGADIQITSKDSLYAYIGNRTSSRIVTELPRIFRNINTIGSINADGHMVPQHFLGRMHVIDSGLAIRRIEVCNQTISHYRLIDFLENEETKNRLSLNIITIAPREILMPANNPITKSRLEKHGITCHEVELDEIHKMGGGLACMILPLVRE